VYLHELGENPFSLKKRSNVRISIIDGSNYFKGLLLLVGKDKKVKQPEIELMKRIGKTLGFEKEFCDNAIRDILENKYIVDAHPVFSSKELALKFIKDGLFVAFSDNEIHPSEEQWLRLTAEKNGIDLMLFSQELENVVQRIKLSDRLEIDDLAVEY
jgi:hypothetical protein